MLPAAPPAGVSRGGLAPTCARTSSDAVEETMVAVCWNLLAPPSTPWWRSRIGDAVSLPKGSEREARQVASCWVGPDLMSSPFSASCRCAASCLAPVCLLGVHRGGAGRWCSQPKTICGAGTQLLPGVVSQPIPVSVFRFSSLPSPFGQHRASTCVAGVQVHQPQRANGR